TNHSDERSAKIISNEHLHSRGYIFKRFLPRSRGYCTRKSSYIKKCSSEPYAYRDFRYSNENGFRTKNHKYANEKRGNVWGYSYYLSSTTSVGDCWGDDTAL